MAFFDAPWWSPGPWTSRNFPPFCGATCPRTQHGCWRHRGKVHRDFGGILKNRGGEPISVGHRHPLHHDGHSRHHPRVREVSDTRCCGFGQTDSQRSLRHHLRNLALPVRHRYLCLGGRFSVSPPMAVDWVNATTRPILEALEAFRFRARFQTAADAIVGTVGARIAPRPQTPQSNDTSTPVPTASHRLPVQPAEPEGFPDTHHHCASSASDNSHLTSPSSA
ncbi:hypothetical protein DFH94DRAFT_135409 [Russula ochroleuca]|uniref:Uncharacterized protein n=1 Tax=Russula ochroleuca TaxID=152965 RepID=A0A9P5JSS5_9AGAM|nr:hypothetical protein DFH94DRAFT_135409 [Russula ochroleuca]